MARYPLAISSGYQIPNKPIRNVVEEGFADIRFLRDFQNVLYEGSFFVQLSAG